MLRARTETGPAWYRYNGDGYGEKANGSPFDGIGIGRPWPLLAGERAHYELAAGRLDVAVQLLGVMRAQASDGGMLPEQVWDGADIPERELFNGRPSGERDAARLGARGVREARALAARRARVRHATAGVRAVRSGQVRATASTSYRVRGTETDIQAPRMRAPL